MRWILKVGEKGVIMLPERLRQTAGIMEGDEIIAEAEKGVIVLRPLKPKPKIVDIDPEILEEIIRERFL